MGDLTYLGLGALCLGATFLLLRLVIRLVPEVYG